LIESQIFINIESFKSNQMKKNSDILLNVLIKLSVFAVAMAFMEAAVVIYLRELMYPVGFHFPLVPIESGLALVEILRELATLVMLISIAWISGRYFTERFACFLYSFAIWDIFYYIFLKLLIGWPDSLMTWDILFLIPATWTGPVISPVIVSISMILLALVILSRSYNGIKIKINLTEWFGLIIGSLILIIAFVYDYASFILKEYSFSELFILPDKSSLYNTANKYIPNKFNWVLFIIGQSLILINIAILFMRLRRKKK
jgi:hypothetical protein